MERTEFITQGDCEVVELAPGVALRVLVSEALGSVRLTTCAVTMQPGVGLPYHTHPTGEVISAVEGRAEALVEGRRYRLEPFDAIHVPDGVAHAVRNAGGEVIVLHTASPTGMVEREFVEEEFPAVDREATDDSCPESLVRFDAAETYALQPGTQFRDLFARRLGSRGVCGGHGLFPPGTSLPCHLYHYDESISIIQGRAICQVAGKEYELLGFDTACIPTGRPHRFLNRGDVPMAMIWVYAGDEPDRVLLEQGFCDGVLPQSTL